MFKDGQYPSWLSLHYLKWSDPTETLQQNSPNKGRDRIQVEDGRTEFLAQSGDRETQNTGNRTEQKDYRFSAALLRRTGG